MRVMCDTNVLVRAALTPAGAAAELLRQLSAEHLLVTSGYQLVELLEVLRRPAIRAIHGLADRRIRRFIARLYKLAVVVPLPKDIPRIVLGDPKDNPIVMTAVLGKADVLCTLDRHLHQPGVIGFCTENGVRVLRDSTLLAELRTG